MSDEKTYRVESIRQVQDAKNRKYYEIKFDKYQKVKKFWGSTPVRAGDIVKLAWTKKEYNGRDMFFIKEIIPVNTKNTFVRSDHIDRIEPVQQSIPQPAVDNSDSTDFILLNDHLNEIQSDLVTLSKNIELFVREQAAIIRNDIRKQMNYIYDKLRMLGLEKEGKKKTTKKKTSKQTKSKRIVEQKDIDEDVAAFMEAAEKGKIN